MTVFDFLKEVIKLDYRADITDFEQVNELLTKIDEAL